VIDARMDSALARASSKGGGDASFDLHANKRMPILLLHLGSLAQT
jgi:hypothetical protein